MNYSVNLDITPGSMPPVLHMSQYDTGRYYTVNLKDGGGDFTPGLGTTAKVKGFNGKNAFEIDATVSLSTVTFQLTDASTDQFGIFPVTIEMTIGSTVLSPLCMIFDVQRAGYTNEQAANSPEFENAMEEAAQKYVLGMDEAARVALLDLLAYAAYTGPDAQAKYDILETALQAKVAYIVADYAQDRTIYPDNSLDVLREGDDLIVTAYFDNGTHMDVSNYTLSGTFTAGTSEITVAFGGKTATISVTVTAWNLYEYSMENGQVTKLVGSTSGNIQAIPGGIEYGSASVNRRSFPTTRVGVRALQDQGNNYEYTIYYPIPIPADAIKAKVEITDAAQYHGESFYTFADGSYTRQADPGWKQGSFTHTFTAGQYEYMTVTSKYNSAGTSYPTEPTALKVTFLTS